MEEVGGEEESGGKENSGRPDGEGSAAADRREIEQEAQGQGTTIIMENWEPTAMASETASRTMRRQFQRTTSRGA